MIFRTLLRRELSAFFLSLTGCVIIAAVTLLVGLSFVVLIGSSSDPFTRRDGNVLQHLLLLAHPVAVHSGDHNAVVCPEKASGYSRP